MTDTLAALDRQSVLTPQRLNKPSEIHVREAIQQRARELADPAAPVQQSHAEVDAVRMRFRRPRTRPPRRQLWSPAAVRAVAIGQNDPEVHNRYLYGAAWWAPGAAIPPIC